MRRLLLSSILCCSLVPAPGHAQGHPDLLTDDSWKKVEELRLRVQQNMMDVLQELQTGLVGQEAVEARRLKIYLGVHMPYHDKCRNEVTLLGFVDPPSAVEKNKAVIWICMQTLLSAREYFHAVGLLSTNTLLANKPPSPSAQLALIDYYAAAHAVSAAKNTLNRRGEVMCTSWNAAYLLVHGLPLTQCTAMSYYDERTLDWAARLKKAVLDKRASLGGEVTDEDRLQSSKDWLEEDQSDIYVNLAAAVIAHELAHLVHGPAKKRPQAMSPKEMLAAEESADRFAARLLAAKEYDLGAHSLATLTLFLMKVSARTPSAKTMEEHLFARSLAGLRQTFCPGHGGESAALLQDKDIRAALDAAEVEKICK